MGFPLGLRLTTQNAFNLVLVLGLLVKPAWAEVTKVDDASEFSEAIHLPFERLPSSRTEVPEEFRPIPLQGDEYASLGLSFLSEGSGQPIGVAVALVWVIGPSNWDVGIRNWASTNDSSGEGLVLHFQYPVGRLGVTLGNGTDQTQVTMRAYGVAGDYLGSVERTGAKTPITNGPAQPFPFLGLSSTVPVASVVVDYGNDRAEEEIHDLHLEYFTPRVFVTYVPQVADGFFEGAAVRTILQIQNAFETPTTVQVDFVKDGEPLALDIDSQVQARLTLDLPGVSCREFETGGTASPGAFGFARIESALPVKAQALYQIWAGEDAPFQESGFQSTPTRSHQIIPVNLDRETGLETAIALVNPSDKAMAVRVLLVQADGSPPAWEPGKGDHSASRSIPAGSNLPLFVSELVPYLQDVQSFNGSLEIRSLSVAVSALRTINGIAVSSAPAVGTDR